MKREGESGAAPRIENFTTCRIPARFAARMKFASRATCSAELGDSRNARERGIKRGGVVKISADKLDV